MPDSYGYFDADVMKFVSTLPNVWRVLDIGPGRGKFGKILKKPYRTIDAIEIFEPYVDQFGLRDIYDKIEVGNICDYHFTDRQYDLAIMGDILEHLSIENAQKVLAEFERNRIPVLVLIPYNYVQGEAYGNIHETHLQPDLTEELFFSRYKGFEKLFSNEVYAVFYKKVPTPKDFPLFQMLEIETSSDCNLRCPDCTRNSYPLSRAVKERFEHNVLPTDVIERIMRESKELGFNGTVCLSHANEPLLDSRISELGRLAIDMGFRHVFLCTNIGMLTDEKISEIDGSFHSFSVSIYGGDKERQMAEMNAKFKKTRLEFMVWPKITTHFSPNDDLGALIHSQCDKPCGMPTVRMVVAHNGEQLMCCDDLVGHFDLGSIYDHSVEELWFSDRHIEIVNDLLKPSGRKKYPYCRCCPR